MKMSDLEKLKKLFTWNEEFQEFSNPYPYWVWLTDGFTDEMFEIRAIKNDLLMDREGNAYPFPCDENSGVLITSKEFDLTEACNRTRVSTLLDYLDDEDEDFQQHPSPNHAWNSVQIVRHMWWIKGQEEFVRQHLKFVLKYLIDHETEVKSQAQELFDEYFGETI